jgi:hypothetical protein
MAVSFTSVFKRRSLFAAHVRFQASGECKYTGRIAALMLVTPEVEAQLKRFPGLLRKPDDLIAVKHRMLIFANHSLSSACELLLSVKLLWKEGHHLAAGHCIRLLFEVWGSLLYAQASVLKKAAESSESAAIADARLQKLCLERIRDHSYRLGCKRISTLST